MKIRKAQFSDLKALAPLFDAYRMFYRKSSDIDGAETFLRERMEMKESIVFVAESDKEELVGFVQLYPLFSSTRMQKFWLLNDLFVHPNSRGQKISIQLIEKAQQLVRDSRACGMFLETEKSNHIGNSLYARTGFELNSSSNYYEWNI